jgi:excisionase family DNA binding protein
LIKESKSSSSADPTLTLTEAADLLGVHYMTVYRYVRTGRLPAVKTGGGWLVNKSAIDEFASTPPNTKSEGNVDWPARLGDRLLAGDEAGAWNVIEASMMSGLEPSEVYLDALAPALAAIGSAWAAGELSIADEHRATAVTNRLIGRLGPRFHRPGQTRGTIVLGAVSGDLHAVPTAIASDLLRGSGFTVFDLGANSPVESFLDTASSADRLIAVGITSSAAGTDDQMIATVAAIKEELQCPVVIGGHGIGSKAREAHPDAITASATEMLLAFNEIAERATSTRAKTA